MSGDVTRRKNCDLLLRAAGGTRKPGDRGVAPHSLNSRPQKPYLINLYDDIDRVEEEIQKLFYLTYSRCLG